MSVLEILGAHRHDRFINDLRNSGHDQVAQEGQRILDYL